MRVLRTIVAIAVGGVVVGAILLARRTNDAPTTSKPLATAVEFSSSFHASQAQRSRVEDIARPTASVPMLVPMRVPLPQTNAAVPAPIATDKTTKSLPHILTRGPLPTSDNLRSAPTVHASPALQAAYEARSSRASTLNRRLERHIQVLKEKAQNANGAERAALQRDISILESQFAARRPLESPSRPTR